MISASSLSEEQIGTIRAWAEGGAQLPEIQKQLQSELGLGATYMDTRFLILDLGIELQSEEVEEPEEEPAEENTADEAASPEASIGAFSLTLDEVTRPGATVSGRVSFSDGEQGAWMIDEMGRPGLETSTPNYQPSEEDMVAFEQELRRLMEG